MKTSYLLVACLAICALMTPVLAQDIPVQTLPKMSNLAFGWVSMSGVDPTLEMLTSFAPASMALRDAGYRTGGEAVTGQFDYSGFLINENFQSAMTALGPGVLRICHYGYDSNTAAVPGIPLPGVLANTNGEAVELSYAQRVGTTILGLSVIPEDSSYIALTGGGQPLVTGNSHTDYGARVGAIFQLPKNLRLGCDYSYQKDHSTTTMSPAITGIPVPVTVEDRYLTRCLTLGASKKVLPRTQVYGAYQEIIATGGALGDKIGDQRWLGVQQDLSNTFAIRVNYLEHGLNFSTQWRSPIGMLNVAYTHNALVNAKSMLGDGDAAFVSLAMAY